MKTRDWLLLFLLWAALAWASFAATITFEWEPSPDATVTGYRLYLWRGTNDFELTNVITRLTTSATNVTWTNVPVGVDWSAFVVAFNADGIESDPSNVVRGRVPLPPGTIKIRLSLQSASDVQGPWKPVDVPCVEFESPTDATKFFRGFVMVERRE